MKKEQIINTIKVISIAMELKDDRPHILFDWIPCILDDGQMVKITEDNKIKYIDKIISYMKQCDTIERIFCFIQKPYLLYVLYYVQEYLDEKEYATVLKASWNRIEFPHQEKNYILVSLFRNVKDKQLIMDEEELEIYNKLDNEITIYRGLQGKKAKVRALSWTLSLDKAKWFANRWIKKGDIYSATIDKENIFMYEDGRDEQEIVVNPTKLKNVRKVE